MIAGARRGEEGQATVELALTLPVVAFLLLALVQVTVVVRDHLLVTHAARAAVREAAVDRRPASILDAARSAAPALKATRVSTETSYGRGSSGIVTVSVAYVSETDVPLVGPLLPDLRLVGKASIPDETDTYRRHTATSRSFRQDSRHGTWNPASIEQYRNPPV